MGEALPPPRLAQRECRLPPDEEGADLFADTVNAAARMAAKAKGGRILASSGLMSARVILRMAHSL